MRKPYTVQKIASVTAVKHSFGYLFYRSIWVFRYRIYTLVSMFILIFLLYSSGLNVPPEIKAYTYEEVDNNLLFAIIRKGQDKNTIVYTPTTTVINTAPKKPEKIDFNFTTIDLANKIKESNGANPGFINIQTLKDLSYKLPITERVENIPYSRYETEIATIGKPLQEVIPAPENPTTRSFLRIPGYGVNAPVIYASFEDMFENAPDGQIDFTKDKDTSDINSPLQKRLQDGVVHIPITPFPGDIGNSYIVGHSSNYSFVKSQYNKILKPIERKGQVGEEFIIYDPYGRELKFRIFETLAIEEEQSDVAYKNFGPTKRVVTLQTSIVSFRRTKGSYPYQRWLVRGELVCGEKLCSEI